ncbi:MAG: DinB family protein [Chitinophagaceae bacterium]|nr:DinB family protein [Chitinophagaceae bacterium]
MINVLKESLWYQFGASIDMVKNAIMLYPEENWSTNKKFFYNAYHCLIYLDYYLTIPWRKDFSAALPFTPAGAEDEIDADAIDKNIPDRIYSKKELLDYLQSSRERCRLLIADLTEEKLNEQWLEKPGTPKARDYSVTELLMYNMRHVQHHAAQLNMLLRQGMNDAPSWVRRAREEV